MGGPVTGVLGAALYVHDEPCRSALRDVAEPDQKLQSIVNTFDVSEFIEQLRVMVPQYHELELLKKFTSGGTPYGSTWRRFMLDVEEITVGLSTRVGPDSSCNPGVYVFASYRLTNIDDGSKSYRVFSSCSGAFSNKSLQEWFAEPSQAMDEIRLVLKLLTEEIAASSISGDDYRRKCEQRF